MARLLTGDSALADVLKVVDASPAAGRPNRRSVVHFYAGILLTFRGDRAGAERLLLQCVETPMPTVVEYRAARAVLARPK